VKETDKKPCAAAQKREGPVVINSPEYKKAGVDIDEAAKSVNRIKKLAEATHTKNVLSGIGGFSGLFQQDAAKFDDLVLAAAADGVGTKVKIAQMLGIHNTIGIDLVAMNADDVVCCGAKPLFFLDYIAVGKLKTQTIEEIIKGIVTGCQAAKCVLLGGETAQMPDIYEPDEYDLAGFCVGAVEKDRILDTSKVNPGDVLIGLRSSGLHSNGYSLARKVLLENGKFKLEQYLPELSRTLGEELLEPTRIYTPVILELARSVELKAVAHITGGGITENVHRVLPRNLKAELFKGWPVQPIFSLIQRIGNISDEEMYRVFNMGVGMVVVVNQEDVTKTLSILSNLNTEAFVVGEVVQKCLM